MNVELPLKKILWISAAVPYDKVPHAGGKIHNFYLKYLKMHSDMKIKLLSFYWAGEEKKIDLDRYGITDYDLIERKIWHLPDLLVNIESVLDPWNRYAGIDQNYTVMKFERYLKQYSAQGYNPDIVILQWTEMLVLFKIVKKYFPCAKIIGIEEDVKFQNYERQFEKERHKILKTIKKIRFERLRKIELEACGQVDRLIMNNPKDVELLISNGVNKGLLYEWQPYFDNYTENVYFGDKKQIIFYGAMGRTENWTAAKWFSDNVMPLIDDVDVKFIIVGSHPHESLQHITDSRVKVIGFVESPGEYFAHSTCLVAPLHDGAGVKIKVLEAMSAGIPVLTTDVGIEGIPAENRKEYMHCETAHEYADAVMSLINDSVMRLQVSNAEKVFISNRFNLEESGQKFIHMLENVINIGNEG